MHSNDVCDKCNAPEVAGLRSGGGSGDPLGAAEEGRTGLGGVADLAIGSKRRRRVRAGEEGAVESRGRLGSA